MVTRHSWRTVKPPTPESNTPTGRGSMSGDAIAGLGCVCAPRAPSRRVCRGHSRSTGGRAFRRRFADDGRRRPDRRNAADARRHASGRRMAGRDDVPRSRRLAHDLATGRRDVPRAGLRRLPARRAGARDLGRIRLPRRPARGRRRADGVPVARDTSGDQRHADRRVGDRARRGSCVELRRRGSAVQGARDGGDVERPLHGPLPAQPRQVGRNLRLRPERPDRPDPARAAAARPSDDRRREPPDDPRGLRSPLEPPLPQGRDDAELPLPGTARLRVRHRPGDGGIPRACRSEAALRRRLRPSALEVPRAGRRRPARPGTPLVRPLPQGNAERRRHREARGGRTGSVARQDRELRRPTEGEARDADEPRPCADRPAREVGAPVSDQAARRAVRRPGRSRDGVEPHAVAAPGRRPDAGEGGRERDRPQRRGRRDQLRPRAANGELQARLGREPDPARREAAALSRRDLNRPEPGEPPLPQARAGRLPAHDSQGQLDASAPAEDDLPVISHLVAAAAAVALVGSPAATPGVTSSTITIGGTGVSRIASEHKKYPWTIGYLPSFVGEGVVYGRRIAASAPRSKIAVLFESSDFGKDLLNGLRRGLGGKAKIVATQAYEIADTSIDSQMARLRASKADTLMLFATPKFAIFGYVGAARLGWDPQIYVSSVSPSPDVMKIARLSAPRQVNGSLSIAFVKDPTQKIFAKDKTVRLYHSILSRFMPGAKFLDVYNYYGMAVASTLVDTLRHAGKNPTRASVLRAATHVNEVNPFLLSGVRIRTSPNDYYPIDKARFIRYANGHWIFGKLVSAQG